MSSAEDLPQMAFGGSSDAAIDLEQADHIQANVVESGVPQPMDQVRSRPQSTFSPLAHITRGGGKQRITHCTSPIASAIPSDEIDKMPQAYTHRTP